MSDKKNDSGRWLMVLVAVVLVTVVGVITWTVVSRREPTTQVAQTAEGTTNDISSAPAGNTPAATAEAPSSTPAGSTPTSATQRPTASPAAAIGTSVGDQAPDFTLSDLNGKSVSLHQFRGHVVILDFWASWCPPCRASMPSLDKFASEYQDKGLVMIGVSLDRSASDASSFLDANNYHRLIALWGSVSDSQQVARTYGVNAIPHTFVIDRNGIIRFTGHPMRLSKSVLDSLFQQ